METATIASNATVAKLIGPSRELKLDVQRILSYQVAGAEHSQAFKEHRWDGKSSFLSFKEGIFPAGFVHYVAAKLKRLGYDARMVKKPLPLPLGPESPVVDVFPEDPRYDYQMDVVRRLEKHGQIIAQVATGGGKSRIAKLAYARINRPTLFLTTRGILMHQMKESFEADLGIDVSVLGDGQFGHINADGKQCIKKMSVGMVQTLVSRLAEPDRGDSEAKQAKQAKLRAQTIGLLDKFELVILEEAHEASGNSYFEILRHCKNAHYRLALTATPFMKDDEEANMRLMACSGPVGIKVTEKMLIDRGILAKPYFKFVQLKKKPEKLYRGTGWQSAMRIGITDNEERNGAILFEAKRAALYGMSVMVLVQRKAHGDTLEALLTKNGLSCAFIRGENDQAERKSALTKLASGKLNVLIGTTILDVGVDVPAVGMIILAGGGKAEVALRQRIGRGLRAKKYGPNVALVVDFSDQYNSHTQAHAQQRYAVIRDTEGFGENVVDDFDFEALGIVRRAA